MALEAVKQTVDSKDRLVQGFVIKNAQIIAPLMVRESQHESTETVLELRSKQNVYEKEASSFEAVIFSYSDGNWRQCFSADVHVDYQDGDGPCASWADETTREETRVRERVESAANKCTRRIDEHSFYRFCEENGFRYGPSFQLLDDLAWDGRHSSTARIDMISARRYHEDLESSVHPAILDAMMQLLIAHSSKGIAETLPTVVPHSIGNTWVSAKVWHRTTSSVRVCASTDIQCDGSANSKQNVYAIADDGSRLCTIEGVNNAVVSRNTEDVHIAPHLLHNIVWKPQLSSLSPAALQNLCSVEAPTTGETLMRAVYPKIEWAMRMSARKALRELTREELDGASGYLKKYAAALEYHYGTQSPEERADLDDSALETVLQECETAQPAWRMFTAVARALSSIIRGETDPLELLFSSKAAEDFYAHGFRYLVEEKQFGTFLDLATHEKPGLKILEVGAGTGGMTRNIFTVLQGLEQGTGQTRFAEYTYTDVSASFFEDAREKFKDFGDRMFFKTLDLEVDPFEQGFEAGCYDMIFAGSVLHVTSDLVATLLRVRKLLKPGGHLILVEVTTIDSACANVGFGSLEGWWSGKEEWRKYSPLATQQRWDELLRESGFSGVDASIRDYYSDQCHLSNIMISSSVEVPDEVEIETNSKDLVFIIDPNSNIQASLTEEIGRKYPQIPTHVVHFGEAEQTIYPSSIVVCLLEIGGPQLASLNEVDFQSLKICIQASQNMLWVTSAIGNESSNAPPLFTSAGFFRSLRNEESNKHIVTLSIDSCPSESKTSLISRVLQACFLDASPSAELEFVVRDGDLTIGRLSEATALNEERISRVQPRMASEPWKPGPPVKLEVGVPGMLDSLRFVEDQVAELAADEVEIEASVWPISFRDVFIAIGRLSNEEMGLECAGVVSRVGSACTARFAPGERVLMIAPGCMRSHPRAKADSVFKLPDNLSFHDAVAGMSPGMTAWYALIQVARLRLGEKVLIHAAAGSTGQMAVKIAKMTGAEVFVTVSSDEKRELVLDLGIPESHVFYSRNTSFAKGIMRVTNGYGVDVVLNSLSGRSLQATWECMAPYGRFVDIGKSDIMANSSLPMGGFARNVSFTSIDLHYVALNNSALKRELAETVLKLTAVGIGGPAPLHFYSVSEVEKALRYMQNGKNTGRILITSRPDDVVLVSPIRHLRRWKVSDCEQKSLTLKSAWKFDANATYLVVGGLGGLGRTVIRWMAERGAKNLIIPSRSGPASPDATEVVSELINKNMVIRAPKCDVSAIEELKSLLRECSDMPPIRGCINLAMVLQVCYFFPFPSTN